VRGTTPHPAFGHLLPSRGEKGNRGNPIVTGRHLAGPYTFAHMRRLPLLLLALTLACTSAAPPPPAAPPKVDEQVLGAIGQLEEAVAQQPANMPWVYLLAMYYDRAYDAANTVKWLTRLDELGWVQGVAAHDFRNTKTPAFREAVAKLEAREPRVNNARPAFTLSGHRDLIPEGITWDPVEEVFYVTSIYRRKVIRVDRDGRTTDFTPQAHEGMLGGLGTHIDQERRLLWVATAAAPEMSGHTPESDGRAALVALDLRDGRVVRKVGQGSKEQPSLLNDFVILRDGTLLVTDTVRNNIVRLAPGADAVEPWLDDLRFPNGIVLSEDQQSLYVADFRGITRVNIADKTRQKIEPAGGEILSGIDGLALHRGQVIAIQNAIGKARVLRIGPDSGQVEVLEAKNAAFEIPTTGVVVGDELWFIANPGLRSFTDGKIWPMERLEEPIVLRLAL
jgi:sugar lactone lactonase YvrE